MILDNHQSHINLDAIDYARENRVVLLSFPSYCFHKLQPLDRTVYGLKRYYNNACNGWIKDHPGSTMTIYDIPKIVGKAFLRAMTPLNIQPSFRASGIYPFDPDIFQDEDFLPSHVSDRPMAITLKMLKKLKISLPHHMLIFLSMLLQNLFDYLEKPLPEKEDPG